MNRINVLIISSTLDYSTDIICLNLKKMHTKYFRLNRDCLEKYKIRYDFYNEILYIEYKEKKFYFRNEVNNSIYYRSPTFLRLYNKRITLEKQAYLSQSSSLLRNLIVFDKVKWMNNPVDTYKAENKVYQLKIANQVGFNIPMTTVANYKVENLNDFLILKSLDSALFRDEKFEYFTYTNIVNKNELMYDNLKYTPVFLQEYLENKIDMRVTFINNKVFPVSITTANDKILGDWRTNNKETLEYKSLNLPNNIVKCIKKLMKKLNLVFGGIDLIFCDGKYYFIEVNPTGEWAWIDANCKLGISDEICNFLI